MDSRISPDEFTDENLLEFNVRQLKTLLKENNLPVSGKRKDLIDRLKGLGKILFTRESVNYSVQEEPETNRLISPLGEVLPNPDRLIDWSEDLTSTPCFSNREVYNYIVLKKKSRVFFEDRHVHSIRTHKIKEDCSHCFVKCSEIPSIPTANKKKHPDHIVWVCLAKETEAVHSGDCTCTAGNDGICNPICALLYAFVDVTEKKTDGTLSSTSQKCKWNNPRKRKLSPKKAQELEFTHTKKQSLHFTPSTHNQPDYKHTFNASNIITKLKQANIKAAFLTLQLQDNHSNTNNLGKLSVVEVSYQYHDKTVMKSDIVKKEINEVFKTISTIFVDEDHIEHVTRGQSKNNLWFVARSQRITSSMFGDICKLKSGNPERLVAVALGYNTFSSPFCKWGLENETLARRLYKKHYTNRRVIDCGLFVKKNYPYLGASPDGLISDGNEGLLEIKCPAADKWRNCHPRECATDPTFYCQLEDGNLKLKQQHKYYFQVQGAMAISKRTFCDFMIWTTEGWTVERIYFDMNFWLTTMLPKIQSIYKNYILPELFSSRVKRGLCLY